MGSGKWGELKASGKPPFAQLPILETQEGLVIGQSIAICNYIGHVAGTAGKDPAEYAMSQMLLAEGEDLYNLMQKYQPTMFVKSKSEDNDKFWKEVVPAELKKVENLFGPRVSAQGDGFTCAKRTTGELYFFSMLHQMVLVKDDMLKSDTPAVLKFYEETKAFPAVAKVLAGNSPMGELGQYFIPV